MPNNKDNFEELAKIIKGKQGSSFKIWIGPYALLAIAYAILEVAKAFYQVASAIYEVAKNMDDRKS